MYNGVKAMIHREFELKPKEEMKADLQEVKDFKEEVKVDKD